MSAPNNSINNKPRRDARSNNGLDGWESTHTVNINKSGSSSSNSFRDSHGGHSGSHYGPASTLETSSLVTPAAQRPGNSGLGLRPPSVHTPENGSTYSAKSISGSISNDSKPASQKSTGIGLVRRLRRLSSAALQGKVNKLFSRPVNMSQDSLLTSGPPSPSVNASPQTIPNTHTVATTPVSETRKVNHGSGLSWMHGSPSSYTIGASSGSALDRPSTNAYDLPPLPEKPISSRRSRALTELAPLAIRDRLELPNVDVLDTDDDAESQRSARTRAKAANSPLVTSPLSRKSFHALNTVSSCDSLGTDDVYENTRKESNSTGAKQHMLYPSASTLSAAAAANQRQPHGASLVSPKLIRSSSHNISADSNSGQSQKQVEQTSDAFAEQPIPRLWRRASPHYSDRYGDSAAIQAIGTPSPPEKRPGKQQAQLANEAQTPTVQRRGPGLASFGWSRKADSGVQSEPGPASSFSPPPMPTAVSSSSLHRTGSMTRKPQDIGTDFPSSLLSSLNARPRISPGLFRQKSLGPSTNSSASVADVSLQPWTPATANADRECGIEDDGKPHAQQDLPAATATTASSAVSHSSNSDRDTRSAALPMPGALSTTRSLFDQQIMDWRLSQDGSTPLYSNLDDASEYDSPSAVTSTLNIPSAPMNIQQHALPTPSAHSAQSIVRPRGGSQPAHLARTATTNAIRLKGKSTASQAADDSAKVGQRYSRSYGSAGSAPEQLTIDHVADRNKAWTRSRACSASYQPLDPGDSPASGSSAGGQCPSSAIASTSFMVPQSSPVSRNNSTSSAMLLSRPPSSMSAYTMSPVSSSHGDDSNSMTPHAWQIHPAMARSSPDRNADGTTTSNFGTFTPTSTSSPSAHHHMHSGSVSSHTSHHQHHGSYGSQQLRLNTSTVQRSASGHSIASGISELLEPSSVSLARKDALWQVLVVSKSRADTEIDKMMRQWKETDSGMILCTQETDSKPSVGDEDAIILKVKRGHHRSSSDIKHIDGDRNEFRRRVIDLTSLIRSSSVSDLSNDSVTRGITEQLYGLLTEQRTRFPADASVGTLILDVLYQFSAVSQTVSQLAMPINLFSGARSGISGEASPALSQYPSPQLVPDLSLGRGSVSMLPPLTSALSSHHSSSGSRHPSRVSTVKDLTENTFGSTAASEGAAVSPSGYARSQQEPLSIAAGRASSASLADYSRNMGTSPEGPPVSTPQYPKHQSTYAIGGSDAYISGAMSGSRTRQPESASYVSSPRLLPGTAHSSTTSLLSLLAPAHSGTNSASGSVGRSGAAGTNAPGLLQPGMGLHQRQRFYFPQPSTTPQSSRMSMDIQDSENEMSARPSLDDANERPLLSRHASRLSISSDVAGESSSLLHKRSARASLQPYQLFHQFVSRSQRLVSRPQQQQQHQPSMDAQQDDGSVLRSSDDPPALGDVRRTPRPATMYFFGGNQNSFRRVSESALRQEKLARLLAEEMDLSDSAPTSPADESSQLSPLATTDLESQSENVTQSSSALMMSVPEPQRSSNIVSVESQCKTSSLAGSMPATRALLPLVAEAPGKESGEFHKGLAKSPEVLSPEKASPKSESQRESLAENSVRRDNQQYSESESVLELGHSGTLSTEATGILPQAVQSEVGNEEPEDELVVCRICDRSFFRSELNAHSDVCILEQTRAMKLDEVNSRIKRLRDPLARRNSDLRKVRQWDKGAIRESGRVMRIAERAIAWPEGDNQQDLIVAKAKFTKYIEKLEDITGTAAADSVSNGSKGARVTGNTKTGFARQSSNRLPKADVETVWLARQLLARISEKRTIIEEFDMEFSRLEQQEALIREAEVSEALVDHSAEFVGLPTWSQLARHNQHSPVASERTSMDLAQLQSESGASMPDASTPPSLGIGKTRHSVLTRKKSRSSHHLSRRSTSRSTRGGQDLADSDSHESSSGSNSGSRKLVSLFAALFRHNSGGFGRNREAFHGGTVLRRKNTPSPLTTGTLPTMAKSNSILRRLSQNLGGGQPSTPTSAQSNASNSSSSNNTASNRSGDRSAVPVTPLAISAASSSGSGRPTEAPLSSPVTRQRNNSQLSTGARGTSESVAAKAQRMPSIDDFDFVKPISRGAFGRVYLARKKATKDLFAIKVMRKKDMINKNMVTQALAERRALSLLSTDWVVQLYYAFHSSKHLFLVMEYLLGGDLAGMLRVCGVMEEDVAKFYFAEIACAIDYLHRNSIVHRDIKPDNVIVTSDGHIKLTDFGLSQVAVRGGRDNKAHHDGSDSNANLDSPSSDTTPLPADSDMMGRLPEKADGYWDNTFALKGLRTQSAVSMAQSQPANKAVPASKRGHARKSSQRFLGTPDYLAPELLLGAGNGLAVDWWALGVCLFEFLCGYPPFTDESPEAIFRNILNHALDWPEEEGFVGEEAAELINALLRPDPAERAHWKDIQLVRLFDGWDLKNIRQREPPFIPQPDDEVDTSYFDSCQRKEVQRLSNATFLQAEAPEPPLPLPRQPLLSNLQTPIKDSFQVGADESQVQNKELSQGSRRGSQKGSKRGSRRERRLSGSISMGANSGGSRSDVGQLKRLFAEMLVEAEPRPDHEPLPEDPHHESSNVGRVRQSTFASSGTSSDGYSFKESLTHEDGPDSQHAAETPARDGYNESSSSSASEYKDNANSDKDDERSSTRSESNSELEILSAQTNTTEARPIAISRKTTGKTPGAMLPPIPMTHAKRVASRSPSQFSDGAADVLGGISAKSHSRCASACIEFSGAKADCSASRSRRPSHGATDRMSESELGLPLVRSSSTDERHQHGTPDGLASALPHKVSGAESPASNDLDDDSDDAISKARDDETERVFDEFAYKNLALLSNVNKGVSSSGNVSISAEKAVFGPSVANAVSSTPLSSAVPGADLSIHDPSASAYSSD
ncbi:hypothetical protein IWW48_003191 [Coemansia sp. RSA 1200]|nr:hypothetical protein IWW48_003191 [Coemansia sp. RSA 1200]